MIGNDARPERKMGAERVMLMLPFNVVMVGRIRGAVDPSIVASALEKLRSRHPLLAVRAQMDTVGVGSYVTDGVPPIPTYVEERHDDEQWIARAKNELCTSFPIETGPMVRWSLIHSAEASEIILCAHHAICDGMSLGYLLRDLLTLLGKPNTEPEGPLQPPLIDASTVPHPPSTKPLRRFIMNLINKKWSAKNIRFSDSQRLQMHEKFWSHNSAMQVVAWHMDAEATSTLVGRSREESVTVNSALWTAFLAAQYDVQGGGKRYRRRSAMAVSTRDKLNVPVGEAFGFYASSLTATLRYAPGRSFWDNARIVHSVIAKGLAKTDLFRMLSAEMVDPSLLDSLYFAKYGLLDETMPKKLLRRMNWHETTYGYALTNVGQFDIPTDYGSLQLEMIYGPLFYSDVEEKIVGVITVGGSLSFILASNELVVSDVTRLRDTAMRYLADATN